VEVTGSRWYLPLTLRGGRRPHVTLIQSRLGISLSLYGSETGSIQLTRLVVWESWLTQRLCVSC
jgi:hypothetical protein